MIGTIAEPEPRCCGRLVTTLELVAGPDPDRREASGLAVSVPPRLLAEEFGRGSVMRFEDVDFPAALTHEPTRRFLRETGLPEEHALFRLDLDTVLPTLTESHACDPTAELPADADRLIVLGHLDAPNVLLLHGETGTLHTWTPAAPIPHALTADVSVLAFALWLLHRDTAAHA
ncbi:SUKH-4 immunity protein [Streptomyces sp. DI166]|uniref:SUKH-4 family immunity protein n=1 Tax=unclassified Streptomyces TaxID=2593676 RepID=UPI0007F3E362|nr:MULTISPECIES: SUKH-4 family immunity protein [unclassified Streptomyces]SBT91768.1 SUKH-4 immunity protein [Streptomyces sp. DI166]